MRVLSAAGAAEVIEHGKIRQSSAVPVADAGSPALRQSLPASPFFLHPSQRKFLWTFLVQYATLQI
jgi:hypothetical protein